MKLVLASNNPHKLEELRAILETLDMDVVSQREIGVHIEPEETGSTFEENSYIKAKTVMDACGIAAVADDSGLMVEALNGEPGIFSARYGGELCHTDAERLHYLLEKMEGKSNRKAKFVSVITMLTPTGKKIVARGECPGEILFAPQGTNGFGYDPIFYVPEEGCTFAQLTSLQKNRISHRARALKVFAQKVREEQIYADK